MSRHLTIPTADTQLNTVDYPGSAPPLLFLRGGFGTIHNWNRVIDRLGGRYRAVLFDARARGKSGTSAGYSVQGAVNDIG
jgi:pimeloyl-ACP methyl ester carboxylesterase